MKIKYFVLAILTSLLFIYCSKNDEEPSYTAIPGLFFEKALIELGIDSDGQRNGKVLSSDIENVWHLDIYSENIRDLTGIEGFKSLRYLDVSMNYLTELDISKNLRLEQLLLNSWNLLYTNGKNEITYLDVSNNTALRTLEAWGNPITCIKANQEQLDNLDEWGWSDNFSISIFSLDCN